MDLHIFAFAPQERPLCLRARSEAPRLASTSAVSAGPGCLPLPMPQSALLAALPCAPPCPISTILFDWCPVRAPAMESPLRHPLSLFRLPCGHCICAIATSGGVVQQYQVPGTTHAAASRVATGPSHLPHSEPPPPPLFAGRRHKAHGQEKVANREKAQTRKKRQEEGGPARTRPWPLAGPLHQPAASSRIRTLSKPPDFHTMRSRRLRPHSRWTHPHVGR